MGKIYYVPTDGALSVPGGDLLLPGTKIDLDEPDCVMRGGHTAAHGLTEERCEQLVKSGVLCTEPDKATGKFTRDPSRPSLETGEKTVDAPEGGEPAPGEKHQPPPKWTFTDKDLKGKNLKQLNALIVERGGAPQESEDLAMALLQSELPK